MSNLDNKIKLGQLKVGSDENKNIVSVSRKYFYKLPSMSSKFFKQGTFTFIQYVFHGENP